MENRGTQLDCSRNMFVGDIGNYRSSCCGIFQELPYQVRRDLSSPST